MSRLPLVSPLDRVLFLKTQPYLAGVSPSVLTALASYTEESVYRAGATIREPGAPVDRIVFIGGGQIEVGGTTAGDHASRSISAPGAIGFAHHFAPAYDAPAVRARTDAMCLEIDVDDLDQILEDHFSALMQVAETTCLQATLTMRALGDRRPPVVGYSQPTRGQTPSELDLVARLALLKQVPFLAGTNLGVLSELARFDPPRSLNVGEVLWREGEVIDRMVVVLDGAFRSQGRFGSVLSPAGATIGANEMFLEEPRFEGWVAHEPSRVISIERELFIDVLEDHFEFAQTYLGRVSSYLIEGWDALVKHGAQRDDSVSPSYSAEIRV